MNLSVRPSTPPLSDVQAQRMNAWWRAANYLSVGQIYLLDNPLLNETLQISHVKPRLLGHWGTTPGLNFIYTHLNRVIKDRDLDMLFVAGPGHGGPGVLANTWLEGVYSETYSNVPQNTEGMARLFRQFSFPGGVPSHVSPQTPGSIHEGGELGYSLSHAFGAVFDHPDLIVTCVVGDGEAETGPLATSWHSNKFLNPVSDGAVLPILHLNGYKIASPSILNRIGRDELESLLSGFGYRPIFVTNEDPNDPMPTHYLMAAALDKALDDIRDIQTRARHGGIPTRPRWPMIVLRTPKGWTGPKTVDGLKTEGHFRSHQVPLSDLKKPEHLALLENWLKSYRPEELFDADGRPNEAIRSLSPLGARRMSANPIANGGALRELRMPDFARHAVAVPAPGQVDGEATRVMGGFLRDVMSENLEERIFRLFGPDETESNRLSEVFEVTSRSWMANTDPYDVQLAPDGRVMEILSEHTCQGWLEGYLLTGRHGVMSCYEAFIHIVDSMFNQHAKWLKACREIRWRRPLPSLNYLLTSHVWRQDHNGFSHQDPGFIDYVVNKKADTVRVYLPPDANTLLVVTNHVLRTWNRINVIVAGKQAMPQWLDLDAAIRHCSAGAGIWEWAGNEGDGTEEPDVVMACAGDVPTLETLAAVDLLRTHLPALRVRVVNVVDLMALEPPSVHPHGLSDADFDAMFTTTRPVIFAHHSYPVLIHRLTYRRTNHANFHVHGFIEEGTTTTPFDMTVLNRLDRFHLCEAVLDHVALHTQPSGHFRQFLRDRLVEHRRYVDHYGDDLPEIQDWRWPAPAGDADPMLRK